MASTKKTYKHLSKAERGEIEILLGRGYSQREIAGVLGRDHTSIGREIRKGSCGEDGRTLEDKQGKYEAVTADHRAYVKRLYAKYQGKKIQEDERLRHYIIEGLGAHWNPDEISGAMRRESRGFYASKTAIYEWLYSEWGQSYCPDLYSHRAHAKKHLPKAEKSMIPDRVSITRRPLGATNRTRYGHYEGDTMVSGKKTGSKASLAVVYERKSRYLDARKLTNLRPVSFNGAVEAIGTTLTSLLSLSLDNGIENRHHTQLSVDAYFCAPYSSWQKGGVENANKMLRRYFPKGMDLSLVSETQLQQAVATINNKPRKSLGYRSALQVMTERGLLVQT